MSLDPNIAIALSQVDLLTRKSLEPIVKEFDTQLRTLRKEIAQLRDWFYQKEDEFTEKIVREGLGKLEAVERAGLEKIEEENQRLHDEMKQYVGDLMMLAEIAEVDPNEYRSLKERVAELETKNKHVSFDPSLHEHDPGDSSGSTQELQIQNPTWSLPG